MHFFGPSYAPANDALLMWRFKTRANEDLRQEFLNRYVPRIWSLGFTIPDPALRKDEAAGRWRYTEPDWSVLKAVVTGNGPATQRRLALRRSSYEEHAWVRAALRAHSARVDVA
jgi:ring-1,2-phenylacetyl-CoA epoxidase subunit PaaA